MNETQSLTQSREDAEDTKPVLFLDVDGVLNCIDTQERFGGYVGIDPIKAAMVKSILAETGARLVVSSTWRKIAPALGHLCEQLDVGAKTVDCTPIMKERTSRGGEIDAWLKAHPWVFHFVILDDDDRWVGQFPELAKHLVRTGPRVGLTVVESLRVVEMLRDEVPA